VAPGLSESLHPGAKEGGWRMIDAVAVLVSGGIDSAVLAAELARRHGRVHPLYLRHGLHWEEVELAHLRGFLAAAGSPRIAPLSLLDLPVGDVYGEHWSISGQSVPDAATPDEAVYLPGRNLLFLAKAGVWCERHGVHTVALAPLQGNPFADNTDEFYRAMEGILTLSLGFPIEIVRPFSTLTKADVIRLGRDLPLAQTFSCISPIGVMHCGRCNKCEERRRAFAAAGVNDPTEYAGGA